MAVEVANIYKNANVEELHEYSTIKERSGWGFVDLFYSYAMLGLEVMVILS